MTCAPTTTTCPRPPPLPQAPRPHASLLPCLLHHHRRNPRHDGRAVLKAILCRGREAMARRIYNAMIADGITPDLSTYNTLIWGFGLCKKMETSLRDFGDMNGHGVAPDVTTYNTLLNAWVRAGDLESARKVFDEMAGAGFVQNSVSYNVMIKGYVEASSM
ncbi:hypothetical protein ABZP36_008360 [Zizania latifolia]